MLQAIQNGGLKPNKQVFLMHTKSETHESLNAFIHKVGIPYELHSDHAKELIEGKFKQVCKDYGIKTTQSEPHSLWQNRAESGIRELKRHVHRQMKARNVPLRLWDFCCKWACLVKACTASNLYSMNSRIPYEVVFSHTPDISLLAEFDFYEPVWYYDSGDFPEPKTHLAISHTYWAINVLSHIACIRFTNSQERGTTSLRGR